MIVYQRVTIPNLSWWDLIIWHNHILISKNMQQSRRRVHIIIPLDTPLLGPLQLLEKDMQKAQSPIPDESNLSQNEIAQLLGSFFWNHNHYKVVPPQAMFVDLKYLNSSWTMTNYRCIPHKLRNHSSLTGVIRQISYLGCTTLYNNSSLWRAPHH